MSCLLALLAAGCLEAPPDTEPAPLCGTTRVLADEFEAESEEWYRYGSTELAAGRVLLYAAPGSSSGMSSTWEYQLAGSELTMQIRRVDVADDGELAMALVNREDDAAGLLLAGGNLSLFQAVGESYIAPYSVPFAPDALWWRLGEAGGELSWSTSTDGSTWIDQGSLPLELVDPVVAEIDLRAASTQVVVEI
ncbi:MAG TPA: hypothetical protein VFU21_05430, partial [Kofleriaceae bacterium]|nr:hypothetical protein [Kofleriaceae bacterium]